MSQAPASFQPPPPVDVEIARPRRDLKKRPRAKIRPPLLPLIDVMFTLLMFFLVAARIRTAEGLIPSNLPEILVKGGAPSIIRPVKIGVLASGDQLEGAFYRIEGTERQFQTAVSLAEYLAAVAQRDDPTKVPVMILPAANVRWEHVVNAFNQAVRAKFKKIGFSYAKQG